MHSSAQRSLDEAVRRHFAIPDQETASLILGALEPVVCRGGAWLFRQGDEGDALYLLARGLLQVWIDSGDSPEGPRLIAEIVPGETVGEIGMLAGGRRSASIRAVRDSLLLRMDAASFDDLGRRSPQLIRHIAGQIAARLRDRTSSSPTMSRTVRTIAVLPLDGRPAAEPLVRRLVDTLGREGPALLLDSQCIGELGAPALPSGPRQEVSPELVDWLAGREDKHRFLVYVADAGETAWSDIATRHADLILLVGSAGGDPAVRPWERALLDSENGVVARQALVLQHDGQPETVTGTHAWIAPRSVDFHLHVRGGVGSDFERLARVLTGRAVGLVLGGGAARGFAHLGVYRALAEAGIAVDWVGGTSIGAVMGAAIAQGGTVDDVTDVARRAFVHGRPFSDLTLPVLSLLRGRRMERLIGAHLTGDIEDLAMPFFCVSSDLGRGRPLIHERGPVALAVRASASLPGVFPPAVVGGQLVIDGAILDNLPVDVMRRRPVAKVIAVDVTSRNNYEVSYDTVPSPWRVLAGQFLPFAQRYRVPGIMSLMLKATEIGTMADVREAGQRADLLMRPPVSKFSLTDVRAFDDIVQVGYEHARQVLEGWAH
jgi:predicted acylesterase/phospholipase RssA/CRP-like cAMP-binding protein